MRDARLNKRLSACHKAFTQIKPFGTALRMQHDFMITALPGRTDQRFQNSLADAFTAQGAMHRQAAYPARSVALADQPACRDALPQGIERHGMQG